MEIEEKETRLKEISLKLYNLLAKHVKEGGELEEDADNGDESDFPIECIFCSRLSFDATGFHSCSKPNSVCSFEGCLKTFKKSSDLRKHEVSI